MRGSGGWVNDHRQRGVQQVQIGYDAPNDPRGYRMGDKTDRLKGQAKEKTGQAAGDPYLAQEGRRDQAKGNLKASGKRAADAVRALFKR